MATATIIAIASAVGTAMVSTAITSAVESGVVDKLADKGLAWMDGKIDQFARPLGTDATNYQKMTNPQLWTQGSRNNKNKKTKSFKK